MTLVIYTYIYISDKTDKSYYIVYVTHPQRPKIVPRLWFWSPFQKPKIQHFTEVWCNCLSQGPWESVQRWLDASPYWGAEGCVGQWDWHLGVGCFLNHFVVALFFLKQTEHGENRTMFRVWKVTMTCSQDRCYNAAMETSSLSCHTLFSWLKSEFRPDGEGNWSINAHRCCNHCHHSD